MFLSLFRCQAKRMIRSKIRYDPLQCSWAASIMNIRQVAKEPKSLPRNSKFLLINFYFSEGGVPPEFFYHSCWRYPVLAKDLCSLRYPLFWPAMKGFAAHSSQFFYTPHSASLAFWQSPALSSTILIKNSIRFLRDGYRFMRCTGVISESAKNSTVTFYCSRLYRFYNTLKNRTFNHALAYLQMILYLWIFDYPLYFT